MKVDGKTYSVTLTADRKFPQPRHLTQVRETVGMHRVNGRWVTRVTQYFEQPSNLGWTFRIRSVSGTYLDMSPSINRHHWGIGNIAFGYNYRRPVVSAFCIHCGARMPKDGSISRWCTGAR